jgi:hypothetical protein
LTYPQRYLPRQVSLVHFSRVPQTKSD